MPETEERLIERAHARRPDGPYPDLAREMRRLMGHDPDPDLGPGQQSRPWLSTRAAESITGVNRMTIADALRGFRASAEVLLRFARTLGGDSWELLLASGYPAHDLLPPRAAGYDSALSPDEDALVGLCRRLPHAQRRLLLSLARAVEESAP